MKSLSFIILIILVGYLHANCLYSSAHSIFARDKITIAVYPFYSLADTAQKELSQQVYNAFLTSLKQRYNCKLKAKGYPIVKPDADISIAGKLSETHEGTLLINLIIIKKDTTFFLKEDGPFSIYLDMIEQLVDQLGVLINAEISTSNYIYLKNQSLHKKKWFWFTTGTAVVTMAYLLLKSDKSSTSGSKKKNLPGPPYFPNP